MREFLGRDSPLRDLCAFGAAVDPEVKVIVASGSTVEAKATDYQEATVRAVLEKPYTPEKLLTTIHRVLSLEASQQETAAQAN